MALSGSTNFSLTRDDLIKASYQHVGALEDGGTLNSTQTTEGALLLNMLIKNWQADGMQLWLRQYGYILPVTDVSKITLGAEGGNAVTSYTHTTTSAVSSSGASSVTLTSITGVATTYVIGIEQDDGTMQWTTVNGAPVGSVVTITDVLTGDVASGANVYVYPSTNLLTNPWEILESFTRRVNDDVDSPMDHITEQEYNLLGNKTEASTPIQWFWDKKLGYSTTGYPGNSDYYLWPRFNGGDTIIVIRYTKRFDDLDATNDNPEFPQNWFLPLMLGLAWLISPKHGIPLRERQMLLQEATMYKMDALNADQEMGSLYFSQSWRGKT